RRDCTGGAVARRGLREPAAVHRGDLRLAPALRADHEASGRRRPRARGGGRPLPRPPRPRAACACTGGCAQVSTLRERLERTPPGYPFSKGRVLAIYSGLMVTLLLAALDQTIVATAPPRVVSEPGGASPLSVGFPR